MFKTKKTGLRIIKLFKLGLLLCAMMVTGRPSLAGDEMSRSQFEIKAVVLVNFLKFIKWPDEAFLDDKVVTIGIVGKNPLGKILKPLEGTLVTGRRLVIKQFGRFGESKDITRCQLLFIGSSEQKYNTKIIETLNNHCILTVSDYSNFIRDGGMITLFIERSHIGFDINQQAAAETLR